MFRARTLCGLGFALVAGAILAWDQFGEAGPPDDGKERTTAELLVGTWSQVSTDGRVPEWWRSRRLVYRANGTFQTSHNDALRVIRLTQREGQYEVNGQVVRHHYELNAEDERNARGTGHIPISPTWSDWEVVSISRDEIVVLCPSGGSRLRVVYHRVK